jgi:hypothetical protein
MAIKYIDADSVEHTLETEPGAGGADRPVHGLAASIVSTFGAIKTAVEAVATLISAGKLAVGDASVKTATEALAALISSGKLAVSDAALGALISAGKLAVLDAAAGTKLDTVITHVDGLEGKLDTLHTDISPPTAGYYGQGSVGTAATQIAAGASQALKLGVVLENLHATQDLYVGYDGSVTNANGYKLRPGQERAFPVSNRNVLYLYGSGATTTYSYFAV